MYCVFVTIFGQFPNGCGWAVGLNSARPVLGALQLDDAVQQVRGGAGRATRLCRFVHVGCRDLAAKPRSTEKGPREN